MSNRLTSLSVDLTKLHREIEHHSVSAAEKAIEAGNLLTEAKTLAGHGNWGGFLRDAGIPIRTAQRYMRLSASPLNATLVTHLGGITSALSFLSKWQLPGENEALHICLSDSDPEDFAFVWRDQDDPDHFMVAAVIGEDDAYSTKRPMLPLIEIEGDQPVDTILTWLEARGLTPSTDWQMSMVGLQSARMVIDPILACTLILNPERAV